MEPVSSNPFDDMRRKALGSGAPATVGIIAALGVTFLLAWFGMRSVFGDLLAFSSDQALSRPWTLLTYPFASVGDGRGLIFFLFLLLWLWWVGSTLERSLGRSFYLATFGVLTLLGSLSMLVGGLLTGAGAVLLGPGLVVAALTMIWCAKFPEATIMLFMVVPFKGKWLAILTAALTLFGYGTGAPLLGAFALIPLALGWLFGAGKLPIGTPSRGPSRVSKSEQKKKEVEHRSYMDSIRKKQKDREERERLRKLFESSISEDDDSGKK